MSSNFEEKNYQLDQNSLTSNIDTTEINNVTPYLRGTTN